MDHEVPAWDRDAVGVNYVWRALADHVQARIAAGEWAPGAMLPGEREMSEEYGVGLGTFRRAIKELRERGAVTDSGLQGNLRRGEVTTIMVPAAGGDPPDAQASAGLIVAGTTSCIKLALCRASMPTPGLRSVYERSP